MGFSLNEVNLIGNLGKDPEVRRMQNGNPVVNLTVATSETWRDKNSGERKEKTEWHRVVIFNEGLCKVAEQYLKKGSNVFIRGALQTRKWTDPQGNEKYTTEVVLKGFGDKMGMLSRASGGGGGSSRGADDDFGQGDDDDHGFGGGATSQSSNRNARGGGYAQRRPPANDMDDDIPF